MLIQANARHLPLAERSVHCVVTSPPYWGLRDYGVPGQLGLESTIDEYVANLVVVFGEVWRVLRDDGTLWLNLGDSYANDGKWGGHSGGKNTRSAEGGFDRSRKACGLKPKDLCMIPARVALALQADGWWVRSDIIWSKPNPMPESVTDRPTTAHEHLFLLAKSERYYYDAEAIREPVTGQGHARGDGINPGGLRLGVDSRLYQDRDPGHPDERKQRTPSGWNSGPGDHRSVVGRHKQNESYSAAINGLVTSRNKRSVWEIAPQAFSAAHFATFPEALVEPCVLAGTSARGVCPACGAPWGRVVERTGRVNQREPAHAVNNTPTKTDSTGWAPTRCGTNIWRPTCDCDAGEPVPAVVFDPFMGSGTTAVVAQRLGRRWVGCELNGDYLAIAAERVAGGEIGLSGLAV